MADEGAGRTADIAYRPTFLIKNVGHFEDVGELCQRFRWLHCRVDGIDVNDTEEATPSIIVDTTGTIPVAALGVSPVHVVSASWDRPTPLR